LVLEDGIEIEGGPITIAQSEVLDFNVGNGRVQRYVYSDSLAVRCAAILPPGTAVLGVIAFRFSGATHAMVIRPATHFVIGAQDGRGAWHETTASFAELEAFTGQLTAFHTLAFPHLIEGVPLE